MNRPHDTWLSSMNWQIEFYQKTSKRIRVDGEFDWKWLAASERVKIGSTIIEQLKQCADVCGFVQRKTVPFSQLWLNEKSEQMFHSRQMLHDELSKLLFDSHLLVSIVKYSRYYYPRFDYDDFVQIMGEENTVSDMPEQYLGLPLKIYSIQLPVRSNRGIVKMISTKLSIDLLNAYRQYFIKRGSVEFVPDEGSVVFDCGACIGDISTIYAALVGYSGAVHLFDPIPLHSRICQIQANLNPDISKTYYINTLAVGEISSRFHGCVDESTEIAPGGLTSDNYETTSLDDYVSENRVSRVDYIKMDIEGSERSALRGAANILFQHKPRLAICAYHKPDDLWEIPELIKKLNPNYTLYFGHHSPKNWESVYYAQ